MLAAMSKPTLEQYASEIREAIKVPRQAEMFEAAVEAGYLAARADGTVDDAEKATLVKAVELLSQGLVLEWETEDLLDRCAKRADEAGVDTRASKVGELLKELGQPEAGLLVAAFVARATDGVAKSEAEMLKSIGKAAGLKAGDVKDIVKRATGLETD